MKTRAAFAAVASCLVLLLASCTTLHQKLAFKPLPPDLPVSASSTLLVDGKAVQPDAYTLQAPFSLRKEVRLPLRTREEILDLYPTLKAEAAKSGGDAIARLKISIDDFHSSDYNWVCFERYFGGWLAVLGGALAIEVSSISPGLSSSQQAQAVIPFAVAGGVGAAIFGGSFIHQHLGSSVYTIGLEGQSVKMDRPPN